MKQEKINELVLKIIELALKVTIVTDYYVFVSYSPHVNSVNFHITPKSDFNEWFTSDIIHLDVEDEEDYETVVGWLEPSIQALENLILTNKFNKDSLQKKWRGSEHYSLTTYKSEEGENYERNSTV